MRVGTAVDVASARFCGHRQIKCELDSNPDSPTSSDKVTSVGWLIQLKPDRMVRRSSSVIACLLTSRLATARSGKKSRTGCSTLSMVPWSMAMPMSDDVKLLVADARSCNIIWSKRIKVGVGDDVPIANDQIDCEW